MFFSMCPLSPLCVSVCVCLSIYLSIYLSISISFPTCPSLPDFTSLFSHSLSLCLALSLRLTLYISVSQPLLSLSFLLTHPSPLFLYLSPPLSILSLFPSFCGSPYLSLSLFPCPSLSLSVLLSVSLPNSTPLSFCLGLFFSVSFLISLSLSLLFVFLCPYPLSLPPSPLCITVSLILHCCRFF